MRKLLILLMVLALMGCICVSAQTISRSETISLGDTKVITVPAPTEEVDPGVVYFQQEFLFTPEQSGTYRFLMRYEDDPQKPYDVSLDIPGAYQTLENGIEFEATAGETYELCFQYPEHDGRYPQFTFLLDSPDIEYNPKTNDLMYLLPMFCLILSTGLLVVFRNSYRTES